MINIVLMVKNNDVCRLAYQWCRDNFGEFNIVSLVAPLEFHQSAISLKQLLELIGNNMEVDLVVSFLYDRIIKEPLISYPKLGCINFHPAPLPEYRGFAPYTKVIIDGADEWGVTAHFIDDGIDTGDIIAINYFEINCNDTAFSLAKKSHNHLFSLFKDIMTSIVDGNILTRTKQNGGSYFSKKDFENLREIKKDDTAQMIDRKLRAFWHPPHECAYLKLNGLKVHAIPEWNMLGIS